MTFIRLTGSWNLPHVVPSGKTEKFLKSGGLNSAFRTVSNFVNQPKFSGALPDWRFWIALTGQNRSGRHASEGVALGYYGSGRWPDFRIKKRNFSESNLHPGL
jgi:hypothetical protein